MKQFTCQCSNPLFFDNYFCLQCSTEVGLDPLTLSMQPVGEGTAFRRCGNGTEFRVCNWLVPNDSPDRLCIACQLNEVIPNLSLPEPQALWAKMEAAKRRAIYSLLELDLPLQPPSSGENFGAVQEDGSIVPLKLGFRFLQATPEVPVMTGHDAGLITMNLEEADDSIRERNRVNLNEPYRTLLGHFRHELGHYYWSLWFENASDRDEVLPAFRELFGDERLSYDGALNVYYQNGPTPGWQERCISAYSTMHPWEEWAETWAHYLHVTDALETFEAFGLRKANIPASPIDESEVALPAPFDQVNAKPLLHKINRWMELSPAINELSSSLGQNMLYPFVVSLPVMKKLHFIHCMIQRQSARKNVTPQPVQIDPAPVANPANAQTSL